LAVMSSHVQGEPRNITTRCCGNRPGERERGREQAGCNSGASK
jgi:hypothetical protein